MVSSGTPSSNTGLFSQLPTKVRVLRPRLKLSSVASGTTIAYSVDNLSLLWDKHVPTPLKSFPRSTRLVALPGFRRFKSPRKSIDEATIKVDRPFLVFPLLAEYLRIEFDMTVSSPMVVGVLWERTYKGSLGCLYMERDTDKGVRCRLSLSGKACASVPIELLLHFLKAASSSSDNVTCSRIDICLDDFTKKLTYENIFVALEAGNHSGFQKSNIIRNFGSRGGWTANLGSRESEHYVRIYDKFAESKGLVDSIRWESEFKHKKAQAVFKSLAEASTGEAALKMLKGFTFGRFQFIEKESKNLDRCGLIDWWYDFRVFVSHEDCEILVQKVVTSIDSSIKWIKYQVEKTLARLCRAFGDCSYDEFMADCLTSGLERLKPIDDKLIADYLNAQGW